MPKIIIIQPFKFAHFGYQVEEFEPSDEPRDTTDECAAVAISEGWAAEVGQRPERSDPGEQISGATVDGQQLAPIAPAPARTKKALAGAPENKAAE